MTPQRTFPLGPRRWRAPAVAAATAACLLAAVPPAHAATPAITTPRYGGPASWRACPDVELKDVPVAERPLYSCATVPVPLDYRHPRRGTIGIAIMRRAAADPGRKIGSLFMNPGGPGASGFAMPIGAARALGSEIRGRFDLVGFDPRGVARSAAVRCFSTQEEADAVRGKIGGIGADLGEGVRASEAYARACRDNGGPLLETMSTESAARDLDLLRQAAGDPELNYVGFSYGTLLGATYVNLFPQRARAIVLDGNVDPVLRTRDGLEYLRQRALGQEAVVNAFLARCAEVGERCAFSAGDPAAKFAAIRDRLRQGPITVPGFGEVTLSAFSAGVGGYLYRPEDYPELAGILEATYQAMRPGLQARPGVGSAAFTRFTAASGATDVRPGADAPYMGDDSSMAVNCLDGPFPRGNAPFLRAVRAWDRQAPTVGAVHAVSRLACGHWPVRDPRRYAGPWNRRTPNPVLLFGNYHDPATNYAFSKAMAAALGNARLVSADAFGHTILGSSACAGQITGRYLLTLAVPPAGVVCQPDRQPFS